MNYYRPNIAFYMYFLFYFKLSFLDRCICRNAVENAIYAHY